MNVKSQVDWMDLEAETAKFNNPGEKQISEHKLD